SARRLSMQNLFSTSHKPSKSGPALPCICLMMEARFLTFASKTAGVQPSAGVNSKSAAMSLAVVSKRFCRFQEAILMSGMSMGAWALLVYWIATSGDGVGDEGADALGLRDDVFMGLSPWSIR